MTSEGVSDQLADEAIGTANDTRADPVEVPLDPATVSERRSTDESLEVERKKTDTEVARKRASADEAADDALRDSRTKADAVLQAARESADSPSHQEPDGEAVEKEREREDAAVIWDRATEDQTLHRERRVRREALVELFKLERDRTDLQLLTERAQSDEALNTRDTFLAMVTHDLRTMLQGISMTAAMLAKYGATEEDTVVQSRATTIQRFTARMNGLVGDLVDVATIQLGRPIVMPERRDLQRLVLETEENSRPAAAAHGIVLTCEIIGQPVPAPFDHDRILQVLANIITNAIKFTPHGGRISLRVEECEEMIRFSVHDTGAGIPADELEAIFERFKQLGRRDRRGLGLGLYISKCIVEGHGGHIWAESAIGSGTTIFFTLPHAQDA